MKIQCDVCERAEASLLCCVDEAVLCRSCDEKVQAANKLAEKHQRLPLYTPSSQSPKCDICQEKAGYFFYLEDRALLCQQCDLSIHTASLFVSAHQRFLVIGVQVALQQHSTTTPANSINPSTSSASNAASSGRPYENKRRVVVTTPPAYAAHQMPSFRPHWPLDEMLLTGAEFDTGREESTSFRGSAKKKNPETSDDEVTGEQEAYTASVLAIYHRLLIERERQHLDRCGRGERQAEPRERMNTKKKRATWRLADGREKFRKYTRATIIRRRFLDGQV